jgi:hypothetical protein
MVAPDAAATSNPDDELAAALMAVQLVLEAEQTADEPMPAPAAGWQHSAKLTVQGLRPARTATAPVWATIERIRRGGGGGGIPGL